MCWSFVFASSNHFSQGCKRRGRRVRHMPPLLGDYCLITRYEIGSLLLCKIIILGSKSVPQVKL